jgi:hypothetical protein
MADIGWLVMMTEARVPVFVPVWQPVNRAAASNAIAAMIVVFVI